MCTSHAASEQHAAADIAMHPPKLSIACLKVLKECAAHSLSGKRQEARDGLSALHLARRGSGLQPCYELSWASGKQRPKMSCTVRSYGWLA